jgi:hypothetical protein
MGLRSGCSAFLTEATSNAGAGAVGVCPAAATAKQTGSQKFLWDNRLIAPPSLIYGKSEVQRMDLL